MMKSKWEFRTLGAGGELIPLPQDRQYRIPYYEVALEVAVKSEVAKPPFSNYFCKESVMVTNGSPAVAAGNVEYGWCQAIHGEESAVSALRSRYGRSHVLKESESTILAIIATDSNGQVPNPCGNCRDVMLEDLGKDLEIVSGSAEGGKAAVVGMKHFLFDRPDSCDLTTRALTISLHHRMTLKAKMVIEGCEGLGNDAYAPYDAKNPHLEREYVAMIVTKHPLHMLMPETDDGSNRRHFGAHDVMVDYHPIYALRDAIRQARRAHDPCVAEVVIVGASTGPGIPPHVMYKDRQHLMEFNLQGELLSGKESNPFVYLLTYDRPHFKKTGEVKLIGAWVTSVKEWLPFAFSPRNFGPEFMEYLTKFYKNGSKRD